MDVCEVDGGGPGHEEASGMWAVFSLYLALVVLLVTLEKFVFG